MLRLTVFLLCAFSLFAHASILVEGSFDATQSCPAYVSKNKKTNPDSLNVQPSKRYKLWEINRKQPRWLRIEFSDQTPTLRWVNADCGLFEYEILKHVETKTRKPCDKTPGMADSYVLALNWQPAFCETYGYEAIMTPNF